MKIIADMRLLGDCGRNLFVLYSYTTAIISGAVFAGDRNAHNSLYLYLGLTVFAGFIWFLGRFLNRRGYKLAIVLMKEAA